MNKAQFWKIINDARDAHPENTGKANRAKASAITAALVLTSVPELQTFELIWKAYRDKLGKNRILNHLARSIDDELYGDGADDAVSWMLIQGQEFVEAVLNDSSTANFVRLLNGSKRITAEVYPLMEAWDHFHPDSNQPYIPATYDIESDSVQTFDEIDRKTYGEHFLIVRQLLNKLGDFEREKHYKRGLNIGQMFGEVLNEALPKTKSS